MPITKVNSDFLLQSARPSFPYSAIGQPDWNITPSRGMTGLSDQDLFEKVKETAKRNAVASGSDDLNRIGYEEEALKAQYISAVSPDRKAILQSAERYIARQKEEKEIPAGYINLIYYLNKADGLIDEKERISSVSLTVSHNQTGLPDYQISLDGSPILRSIDGKWNYQLTPEELERSQQINSIFETACQTENNLTSKGFQ